MTSLKEHLIMWPTLAALFLAMCGLLYGISNLLPDQKAVYDCSIAEISLDFTPAMREECRKIKKETK